MVATTHQVAVCLAPAPHDYFGALFSQETRDPEPNPWQTGGRGVSV